MAPVSACMRGAGWALCSQHEFRHHEFRHHEFRHHEFRHHEFRHHEFRPASHLHLARKEFRQRLAHAREGGISLHRNGLQLRGARRTLLITLAGHLAVPRLNHQKVLSEQRIVSAEVAHLPAQSDHFGSQLWRHMPRLYP